MPKRGACTPKLINKSRLVTEREQTWAALRYAGARGEIDRDVWGGGDVLEWHRWTLFGEVKRQHGRSRKALTPSWRIRGHDNLAFSRSERKR
jgi:hypothetical protein